MMRVPWVLPVKEGPEFFDGARGRLPAIVVVTLGLREGMQRDQLHRMLQLSEFILSERKGLLLQFYRKAIDAHQNGIVPISSRYLNVPGMQARYRNNNGLEIIEVTLYPEFFLKPPKPPENPPWDYLVIEIEYPDIDTSGAEVITRAKVRRPKIYETCSFVTMSGWGSTGKDWDGDLYNLKTVGEGGFFNVYDIDRRTKPSQYGQTWVGKSMADAWGPPWGKSGAEPQPQQDGDSLLAHPFEGLVSLAWTGGGSPYHVYEKIGVVNYILDLRAYPAGVPIDVELRAMWASINWPTPDAPLTQGPPLKIRYKLWKGGVVHYGYDEGVELEPAKYNGPPESFVGTSSYAGGPTMGPYLGTATNASEGDDIYYRSVTFNPSPGSFFMSTVGDSVGWSQDEAGALWMFDTDNQWRYITTAYALISYPVMSDPTVTNMRYVNHGMAERKGELASDVPVDYTFRFFDEGDGLYDEEYTTPGAYIGNVMYDPNTGAVSYSRKKGPDPKLLEGSSGPAWARFYAEGHQ